MIGLDGGGSLWATLAWTRPGDPLASASSSATAKVARAKVRTYLASLPVASRKALRQLRALIREAAPGVTDAFSYGIPGFRLHDRGLVAYAAWKEHTSIYPLSSAMRRAAGPALKRYDTTGSTIRFPLDEPLPAALVRRIMKARVAERLAAPRASRG